MKYAQIIAQIEAAIADGDLAPGDRLPPERALAEEHGVSRMTVRQALQSLESRGLLRRSIGRNGGSFVARPKVERDLGTFSGLSEQLARQGVAAGARVLSAREVDDVVEIVRVRLADGEPFAVERSSFPADRFRGLLDLRPHGLAVRAARRLSTRPVRAVERIEPVLADADDAAALGLRVGAPLMLVDRVAYDARRACRRDRARRLPRRPHAHRRLDQRPGFSQVAVVEMTTPGRRLDGARQGARVPALRRRSG